MFQEYVKCRFRVPTTTTIPYRLTLFHFRQPAFLLTSLLVRIQNACVVSGRVVFVIESVGYWGP